MRQACTYCDFHFSTTLQNKEILVASICKEIELRKNYLNGQTIDTIYFGGGTPSLLTSNELGKIFESISKYHSVAPDSEITLEANPDDLNQSKLIQLNEFNINRLSIGIQSFFQDELEWMNRAHSTRQAIDAIKNSFHEGIENISVDLIFGTPLNTEQRLIENIKIASDLPINHISLYGLTIEKETALWHSVQKKKTTVIDDLTYRNHFLLARRLLRENGFDAYEVSNFARGNQISKHNSSYWFGSSYLGLGPSAHSYNGTSRQWNVSNNMRYIKAITNMDVPFESEELTPNQLFNEFILTRLRTKWGINTIELREKFGKKNYKNFQEKIKPYLFKKEVNLSNNTVTLTDKGLLFADQISSDLFK